MSRRFLAFVSNCVDKVYWIGWITAERQELVLEDELPSASVLVSSIFPPKFEALKALSDNVITVSKVHETTGRWHVWKKSTLAVATERFLVFAKQIKCEVKTSNVGRSLLYKT